MKKEKTVEFGMVMRKDWDIEMQGGVLDPGLDFDTFVDEELRKKQIEEAIIDYMNWKGNSYEHRYGRFNFNEVVGCAYQHWEFKKRGRFNPDCDLVEEVLIKMIEKGEIIQQDRWIYLRKRTGK